MLLINYFQYKENCSLRKSWQSIQCTCIFVILTLPVLMLVSGVEVIEVLNATLHCTTVSLPLFVIVCVGKWNCKLTLRIVLI